MEQRQIIYSVGAGPTTAADCITGDVNNHTVVTNV